MKFKNLTDRDRDFIRVTYYNTDLPWGVRMRMLTERFNVQERTMRIWIKEKLGLELRQEVQSEQLRDAMIRHLEDKEVFFITYAQNATPVHAAFWDYMKQYAEFLDAEIVVVAGRYQNPSLYRSQDKVDTQDWWDEDVLPYLTASRVNVCDRVTVAADVKITPTAVNPLSGFNGFGKDKTCIFGHPKVHLQSLPVFKGNPHVLHLTTGACTLKNYSDTKAGKKSEFHHQYGFVIVEVDENGSHIRQVTAKENGSFEDLYYRVSDKGIETIDSCAGFVMGDLHVRYLERGVFDSTLEYFNKVEPEYVILHDLFDGDSINHHESKDPIKKFQKMQEDRLSVKKEMEECLEIVQELIDYNPVVVNSNHPNWLDRWLRSKDWKEEIHNALEYIDWVGLALRGKMPKGVLAFEVGERFGDKVICLEEDESFKVKSWEVGQHGYNGTHGSKGNLEQFRKLNTKAIVGDFHSPGRKDSALNVGTYTKLRMDYNKGASAWMHCGAVIHNSGKVQQIFFVEQPDGSYRYTNMSYGNKKEDEG